MTGLATVKQVYAESAGCRLVVYRDHKAFAELREAWRELESRDSRCGVFQTHTWVSHVQAFETGAKAQMELAVVYGPDNRIDAIAPMAIEKRLGPLGVRVLRFIGRTVNDYHDILLADDCDRDAVLSNLANWLHLSMQRLDIIEILKLREDSHLWEHRFALFPGGVNRCAVEAETYDQFREILLRDTFDQYLLQDLSKSTRKTYRKCAKQLDGLQMAFRTLIDARGANEVLQDLFRLHQQRQIERGQRGLFRSPQRIKVYTDLFKAMLGEGTLRLHILEVNGRRFCIEAVFYHRHMAICYNGAMDNDPEILCHSPGSVTMMKVIEYAHSHPELKRLSLGLGDEAYKQRIAKQVEPLQKICCVRTGLRSRIDQTHRRMMAWAQQNALIKYLYSISQSKRHTAVDPAYIQEQEND